MFSSSRANYLLQFIRNDEIQRDILADIFLSSSESDTKNCYYLLLLNDLVSDQLRCCVIIAVELCSTISFVSVAI